MSLKVPGPGRAGACTDMAERQPYHPPIPEPQRAPHEGGNGSPGLPRTVQESAKPPPEGHEPHQETETVPASTKRPRGRPKLSEFTEEDRERRWVERHERLLLRELRRDQRQREATLSESERRNLKELIKATQEGAKVASRKILEGSITIKFRNHEGKSSH
jgi:hypothetical protein